MPKGDKNYVVLREDRRKNLRKQLIVLKVKGSGMKGAFFGYAKTISRGGMFISSVSPRAVGEEFELCFELPGTKVEAVCRCKVVWMREYDPKTTTYEPGMGVSFIDLPGQHRTMIDEWIKENEG